MFSDCPKNWEATAGYLLPKPRCALPVECTAWCPGWKSKDRPGTVRSVRGGWETWKGTSMCEYAKNVGLENNRLQQFPH